MNLLLDQQMDFEYDYNYRLPSNMLDYHNNQEQVYRMSLPLSLDVEYNLQCRLDMKQFRRCTCYPMYYSNTGTMNILITYHISNIFHLLKHSIISHPYIGNLASSVLSKPR